MTATDYKPVAQNGQMTLGQLIERMRPEIARALPRHMSPDRMARIAQTALKQTPALQRCSAESFLGALMTCAQLGLEPGPNGEAYLIPYGSQATFVPGYKGLIKLAWQSERMLDIWAEIVYANDEFDYDLGLERTLRHKPAREDRGKPTHVYAAAKLKGGGTPFVVMTTSEVEAIRASSKSGKSGPWASHWDAMAKKTAVKQLAKWLPMCSELSHAVQYDGAVRTEVDAELIDAAPVYVEAELEPVEATE